MIRTLLVGIGILALTGCAATAAPAPSAEPTVSASAEAVVEGIVNVWSGAVVDPTALPVGSNQVTTDGAQPGYLFVCRINPNGPGAQGVGDWVDEAAQTFDITAKLHVLGANSWAQAAYSEVVEGESRILTSNGLPVDSPTGDFPIAQDDPAYQVDRNPNSVAEQSVGITLPAAPTAAATPTCLPGGAIAMFTNGVVGFASFDAAGRDAVAIEVQDSCDGHPNGESAYHYHSVSECLGEKATGPSTVVGWAFDGFPIVVERDASGALPTNADLDACHGRTSDVLVDGEIVSMYHYSATLEFPYFIGCFTGTQQG